MDKAKVEMKNVKLLNNHFEFFNLHFAFNP